MESGSYLAVIKVAGVGGGGTNAVNRMVDAGLRGVEFIAANTDAQALQMCDADLKLNIGHEVTKGLAAGANPDSGRSSAAESPDLITIPGLINLDFADVRAIMTDAGSALMGIGTGSGEDRAAEAARMAISSPLREENVDGATGILLNITGGRDLGLFEVNEAAEILQGAADSNANIIFGAVLDESQGDDVRVP